MGTIDDATAYEAAVLEIVSFAAGLGQSTDSLREHYKLLVKALDFERRNAVSPRIVERIAEHLATLPSCPGERRIAVLGDIHGNLRGLLAALADAAECRCDRIMCLGDIVDGGEENEEVVSEIRERGIPSVRGNHDEFNALTLRRDTHEFLRGLPEDLIEGDVLYTHISPRARKVSIHDEIEAWNAFNESTCRLAFVGHVHRPLIFGQASDSPVMARKHTFEHNTPYRLDLEDRYIIVAGAVGYSRDAFAKIRYAIYDEREATVEFRMVDGPVLAL